MRQDTSRDGTLEYDLGYSSDFCQHADVSPEAAVNRGSSQRSRFRPWPSAEASDCTEMKKRALNHDLVQLCTSLISLLFFL